MRSLDIGPGTHPLPGFETMDMVGNPTIKHDIRNLPWPIKTRTYNIVYMSHILEHIPWFQTEDVLLEVKRILKRPGKVEIWVPDFNKIVQIYLDHTKMDNDLWRRYNPENDLMKLVNGRIFTYGPGEENWHRAVFDFQSLTRYLRKTGYVQTERLYTPRGYDHGWINLGVAAKVFD